MEEIVNATGNGRNHPNGLMYEQNCGQWIFFFDFVAVCCIFVG